MSGSARRAGGARRFTGAVALALSSATLWAEYPLIGELNPRDLLFKQLQEQISEGYEIEMRAKAGAGKATEGELSIYRYRLDEDVDVFELAARINLPYEAISTLNRFSGPGPYRAGRTILVPSRPGVFIPAEASSELEALMLSWRGGADGGERMELRVRREGGKVERFSFMPAARFTPEERAYFLNGLFIYPLPKGRLTSSFGFRVSPISGSFAFHAGIDLAAPEGTEVYAARGGTVVSARQDDTLGNVVIVDHGDGYSSVYGHLSFFSVSLNQPVKSGMIIGKVGSTGKSTGPHLHFEIRSGGAAVDPSSLMPRTKRR